MKIFFSFAVPIAVVGIIDYVGEIDCNKITFPYFICFYLATINGLGFELCSKLLYLRLHQNHHMVLISFCRCLLQFSKRGSLEPARQRFSSTDSTLSDEKLPKLQARSEGRKRMIV